VTTSPARAIRAKTTNGHVKSYRILYISENFPHLNASGDPNIAKAIRTLAEATGFGVPQMVYVM
jgi:hypothetical protein